MSDRFRTSFRGYLIDHHSPDPPVVTLDKLDPAEYERFFQEARIDSLMMYCKDHWGSAYYDTKVGRRHPGLKQDWVAQLRPILAKHNIEFNAYYCLEYEYYAPVTHPEWSIRKVDGTPMKLEGRMAKWRMPCYRTQYRDYVLAQLEEIASAYSPDSLFLDIFGKSLCYCDVCRQEFATAYGYPIPVDEAGLVAHNADVVGYLNRCAKEMLQDIRRVVKGVDPTIAITINFAALYNKEIRDLLDYQFTEPWAGNWLSAAYARDTAPGQSPQLGPGDVSEVYDYRPVDVYRLAVAEIAAQGCRVFLYSGSQHPDGTLEHEEARRIGVAYAEVERYQKYLLDREIVADVAILQSDRASEGRTDNAVVANAIGRVKQNSAHRDAVLGAMKLCDDAKIAWRVLPEQEATVDRLAQYQAVLLPEVYHVDDRLRDVLVDYIAAGGSILSAGQTGLYGPTWALLDDFALAPLYGCSFRGCDTRFAAASWSGYLRPVPGDPMFRRLPDSTPPVSEKRMHVEVSTASVAAYFVDPVVALTEETWVNWWCPPPSSDAGGPAILRNRYGKGRVVHAAFNLFTMQNKGFHLLKDLFRGIVDELVEQPRILLETPHRKLLGFVAYDRPALSELIVHEVNHTAELAEGDTVDVPGGILVLDAGFRKINSVECVFPDTTPIQVPWIEEGGHYRISLPPVSIHRIFRIGYANHE